MKKALYLAAAAITICVMPACNNTESSTGNTTATPPKTNLMVKVNWLAGAWKNSSPEGTVYEVWEKENDSVLSGKSFFVKGSDTIPQETMKLQQNGEDLYYIPTVAGQNGGQPVSFKMKTGGGDELVFENPAHDFPQKITYNKVGNDSLLAAISGTVKGELHTEQFPMGRVK